MKVALANAPVSYGVFEMTVGSEHFLAPAERLLDEVVGAGYRGIDLGPARYLGSGAQLARRLSARGLGLAGGYIELSFVDHVRLAAEWPKLDALLDTFDAVRGKVPGPPPRPTLAAGGSEAHWIHPGQAGTNRSIGLDDVGWKRFADGLRRVVRHCRERGYEPTFHHHAGTHVEAPWEIERVLGISDVGLCLDTGHLMIGGGHPGTALRAWGRRINHIHVKDVHLSIMADIVAAGGSADQIWSRGVFCALGEGDLDVGDLLAGLGSLDYEGWLIVEQDVLATENADFERAVTNQRANLRFLMQRGLLPVSRTS